MLILNLPTCQSHESTKAPCGDYFIRRILFAARPCYLDDSNGAAVASRAMMEALGRLGFAVEVLCGAELELHQDFDPTAWLAG